MVRRDLPINRIKLQHLRVVMAIARSGSMGKAANQLGLSQPVISKVIAELETVLGVTLFDRGSKGVTPTVYGQALLLRSTSILDDLKTSIDEINYLADPTQGELRFGGTDHVLSGLGLSVMQKLLSQAPGLSFKIIQADTETLLNHDLLERRIELAIVPLPSVSLGPDFCVTPLIEDHLCIIAGSQSRWAKKRKIRLADLQDDPWCISPTPIGSLIGESFAATNIRRPDISVVTASALMCLELVESGKYLGHFGQFALRFFKNRFAVKRLPIKLAVPNFHICIVSVANRTLSPLATLFIKAARESASITVRGY